MRIGRAVLGVLLLVVGAGIAAAGIVGITSFGTSGTIRVTSAPLQSADGYALVHDVVAVSAGFPVSEALGDTTIGARSAGGQRLFIGLGETDDVTQYLSGVPYEAVQQDGLEWQSNPVPGPDSPKPPEDEDFWIRQSSGNDPAIGFSGSRGTATFVVMNADGSKDVQALITVGYTSTLVFPISIAAAVMGLVLAATGLVLILRSRRAQAPSNETPAPGLAPAAEPTPPLAPQAGPDASQQPQPVEAPEPEAELPEEWFREQDSPK